MHSVFHLVIRESNLNLVLKYCAGVTALCTYLKPTLSSQPLHDSTTNNIPTFLINGVLFIIDFVKDIQVFII